MNMRMPKLILFIILLFNCSLLVSNCAISPKYHSSRTPRYVVTDFPEELANASSIYTFTGTASWYGPDFHGKPTASGEIYDMNKISAAVKDTTNNREFPLGTWLRVTNLKNNRTIHVRVNDRGPFIPGRDIDLSKKAAEVLGFIEDGLAEVKIEVLRWGKGKDETLLHRRIWATRY